MTRVSKRCVVYLRVSTAGQSLGSGLVRQLEECTRYALDNGLHISAVFGDSCSGDGPMPNRQLAYVTANLWRCPILVEMPCRWSRMRPGTDPLHDANVVIARQEARDFRERIAAILDSHIGAAVEARIGGGTGADGGEMPLRLVSSQETSPQDCA
jgi:hypothetical protein